MKQQLLKHWPTSLLAGACVLLALWLIGELLVLPVSPGKVHPSPPSHQTVNPPKAEHYSLPPVDKYQAFVEQPLFVEGRTPVAPESSDTTSLITTPVSANPPKVELTGILETPDTGQLALLRSVDGKHHYRLKTGDDVEGWRVEEIATDHVVLEQGSRRHTLKLIKPRLFAIKRGRSPRPKGPPPHHRPRRKAYQKRK